MDIKKTNISFDEKLGLYKLDLGFYTEFFEYIYFFGDEASKVYGNKEDTIFVDSDFSLQNTIIGMTSFYSFSLICFINTENFQVRYFLVNTAYLFSYRLQEKSYLFFMYSDIVGKEQLYHNCDLKEFDIKSDFFTFQKLKTKCEFQITNTMLGVPVFTKRIYLPEKRVNLGEISTNRDTLNYNIVDFFLFDDVSSENNLSLITHLNEKVFQVGETYVYLKVEKMDIKFFPQYKISIFINYIFIDTINIQGILKLFLGYYKNQFFSYVIDNINIKKQIDPYFENIQSIQVEKMGLDIVFPENIYEFDEDFTLFQENCMKLRYIYFMLALSLESIQYHTLDGLNNSFIDAAKIRIGMNKESLNIMVDKYKNLLEGIYSTINKKKK